VVAAGRTSCVEAIQRALRRSDSKMDQPSFKFRLYVAGDAANSLAAVANLNAICSEHLAGRFEIEIVDVFFQPDRALDDGVFLTPTLVKLAPPPVRKIVGSLTQITPILQAIGISSEGRSQNGS
jgi:circadian clock protein KaiB